MEDVVRTLGFLCLGTRMRRLGERLQSDTQRIIGTQGAAVAASQFPFLAAIDRLGPLTVGELAEAIGITQPGATRTVSQLVDLGLLETGPASDDQRKRIVALSEQGRTVVDRAKRDLWPLIETAVRDLCGELTGPLLEQLAAIEDGLAETPLERRIARRPVARTE